MLLCFLLVVGVSVQGWAQIQVRSYLNSNVIGNGQQFTLNVEMTGKDAKKGGNPDLPDLSEFALFLGSGSSQSIQIVNGSMSVTKTMQYHFQAQKTGIFTIGPVKVAFKGKIYQTDPVKLRIEKSGTRQQQAETGSAGAQNISDTDLFLRVIPSKKRVYRNEPVLLEYKLYTRVNVSSFGFKSMPGTKGFWTEDFTKNQKSPVTTAEVVNGVRYTVASIKKMALFPMGAGTKTIDPMIVICSVRQKRRSRDVFDSFFDDPFGRQVNKSIVSDPVTITVLPLPEEGKPRQYGGIVGNYAVSGGVDKKAVPANEAVSYKITIKGSGNIKTLPEPEIAFPPGVEAYPPKVTQSVSLTKGIVHGTKTFEYVLIPRKAGAVSIPPFMLPVFNPVKKKYETLSTKPLGLTVTQNETAYSGEAHTGLTKEEVMLVDKDIRFIKTGSSRFYSTSPAPVWASVWFWLVLVLPVLGIPGAVLYRTHQDKLLTDEGYARNHRSGRIAKKRFEKARKLSATGTSEEFYSEVGRALLGYVSDKLNIAEAGLITKDAAARLKSRGVPEQIITEFFDCVKLCDLNRFSPMESAEQERTAFLQRAEAVLDIMNRELRS